MSEKIEENVGDNGTTKAIYVDDRTTIFEWITLNCKNAFGTAEVKLESESFVMEQNRKIEWRLVLERVLQLCDDCNNDCRNCAYIGCFLQNCLPGETSVALDLSISIIDNTNMKILTRSKFISGDLVQGKRYGFEYFIHTKELESLSKNGDLKIICEIKNTSDSILENLRVLKGYKSFINNANFSDIVLYVGNETIHAHKVILASKSPYFNKMFSDTKIESNIDESKVNDIEPEVFMELLRYIYTGRIEKLDQLALQIFKAAHFYEMYDLKNICEQVLRKNIAITNAIENLKLADDYDGKEMKEHCIAFILQNFKNVMKSAEIKGLIKTHPHLPFELLIEMGSK